MPMAKRLIDANELLTDPYFQDETIPERFLFIEAVNDSPTVPAVEVVRCRDCIHGEIAGPDFPDQFHCRWGCGWNKSDFFCSHGKRKEAPNET